MLEGKTANANQSINQSISGMQRKRRHLFCFWFTFVISLNAYTLEASTKPKQLRKHIFVAKRIWVVFLVTYARAELGKIAALFSRAGCIKMCFHEAVRGPNRSLLLTTKTVRFSYPHRNDSSSLLPYLRESAIGHVPVVVLKFLPCDILLAQIW